MAGTVAGDLASSAIRAQIDQAVAGLPSELRDTVEKLIINAVAASAGGLVGGLSGAGGAAVADMYNRQLHPDERTLAKKLAESFKARGMNVSVEQIEEQMRWMGVQDIASGTKQDGDPIYKWARRCRQMLVQVGPDSRETFMCRISSRLTTRSNGKSLPWSITVQYLV